MSLTPTEKAKVLAGIFESLVSFLLPPQHIMFVQKYHLHVS